MQTKCMRLARATGVACGRRMMEKMNAAAFALACAICGPATAQTTNQPLRLDDVIVQGREDSLIGIADSAAQGTVGAMQLERRPIAKGSEILEAVPGVIITQHSGGGKANQYFLRGFNLDHGTDFATSIDGVPINLPTHGHGQGYTDLNILVPEFVQRINYRKGPYYADVGDFSSAGAADIKYFKVLPHSFAQAEGGSFGYGRGVFGASPKVGDGHLLYGGELYHYDGPWKNPDNYRRFNGIVGYSAGDAALGYSVKFMGYKGEWEATDQVARRALARPGFGAWDSLDTSTGGDSHRYALDAEWHRADDTSATRIVAYASHYDLDLFSNFTWFLDDPVRGDQFEQGDERVTSGLKASHTWFGTPAGRAMENTVGLQVRHDAIDNGLFRTMQRQRFSVVRTDDIGQTSVGPFVENRVEWTDWFRSIIGARVDYYHFDVDSRLPGNSGNADDIIASPKGSLVFGPWNRTEVYLSGGLGFHSNDGRGTTAPVGPVDPLVQTHGAEVGLRTTAIPNLHSTVSFWWLDVDSELLFIGDAGTTEASRPSRRHGVEFANYYTPTKWLTLDADLSLSQARFRDAGPDRIPGAIESVVAAGFTLHEGNWFGGMRLRYFGPRPLTEDNEHRSIPTVLVSANAGYRFNETWTLTAEFLNLLDRRDSEIDYWYESRLPGETSGRSDRHFHAVDPFSVRIALTARF
jgi:outer membrane receptor protein involved in Fe transport